MEQLTETEIEQLMQQAKTEPTILDWLLTLSMLHLYLYPRPMPLPDPSNPEYD